MGHIDPTKDVFAQFRANDREGPIHMLNLVKLRPRAAYPDEREAAGAEAYAAYGRESEPVFSRLGGSVIWRGRFQIVTGPDGNLWFTEFGTRKIGRITPGGGDVIFDDGFDGP